MRLTSGSSLFAISSTFFWVMPFSSASISAKIDPLDDVEPLVVAWRTAGAERLLRDELRQDDVVVRVRRSVRRLRARPDASVVKTSQRPAKRRR